MQTPLAAVVLLAGACSASGQVQFLPLPPGVQQPGPAPVRISADGSTVAFAHITGEPYEERAYLFDGQWSALPRVSILNWQMGLSADGGTSLMFHSNYFKWAVSVVGPGVAREIASTAGAYVAGALTRDGGTAYIGIQEHLTDDQAFLARWDGAETRVLGPMPVVYGRIDSMLAGERDDLVVINADQRTLFYHTGGPGRTVVWRNGTFTELATLPDRPYVRSFAADMNADGSIIIGNQQSWDAWGNTWENRRSWINRDDGLSEVRVDGFAWHVLTAVSDDGSVITGHGLGEDGLSDAFVLHANGAVQRARALLLGAGHDVLDDDVVRFVDVSADGRIVLGVVYGAEVRSFRLTLPSDGL